MIEWYEKLVLIRSVRRGLPFYHQLRNVTARGSPDVDEEGGLFGFQVVRVPEVRRGETTPANRMLSNTPAAVVGAIPA
jgi:hypothetical protein